MRDEIHKLVRDALALPEGPRLTHSLKRLRQLSLGDCGTLRMQTTVQEFLMNLRFYRTYRLHPSFGLPHTTNVVESMCRLIREMFRSSRAGSNPNAALLWATAFIRLRSTLVCNGYPINRKS